MEDKSGNWATVVNTGDSCGLPRLKRIDSKGASWIAVGHFTVVFPSHIWDYLVREVYIEREKQAMMKKAVLEEAK